jgi:hypothetical protein
MVYTSGLWVEYTEGVVYAIARSMLLIVAYHFRYRTFFTMLIGLELIAGVLISITDVWIYVVTDCACILNIDGAFLRLVVRTSVLIAIQRIYH